MKLQKAENLKNVRNVHQKAMNTVKYKTETQEFVGRCKELFQIFIEEKITLDEMQRELKEMSSRQLVIPACRESFRKVN